MEQKKKPTNAQLQKRIENAIVFVPKTKDTISIFFSDKGVRLVADNLDYLAAAIKCIRNSSCASGMLNIYVAASTDADDAATLILSEFSTSAGMMAVAVDETVKIKEECAEAKVIL